MLEIIGGVLGATLFFYLAGKFHGVAKVVAIVCGILCIGFGIHGVIVVFY